jgi:hypothetical protein
MDGLLMTGMANNTYHLMSCMLLHEIIISASVLCHLLTMAMDVYICTDCSFDLSRKLYLHIEPKTSFTSMQI